MLLRIPFMSVNSAHSEERRREPRSPARGVVTLRPDGGPMVTGKLVDIARSGFRAGHSLQTLLPNHEVEFEIAGFSGRARVVWTRILGQQVESGFLILSQETD